MNEKFSTTSDNTFDGDIQAFRFSASDFTHHNSGSCQVSEIQLNLGSQLRVFLQIQHDLFQIGLKSLALWLTVVSDHSPSPLLDELYFTCNQFLNLEACVL